MGADAPIRKYVKKLLEESFPTAGTTIRSDTNGELFRSWTGWSHTGLQEQWTIERQDLNAQGKMKAVTTSCNAFLGILAGKIAKGGGMTLTKFQSFNLPKERGWVWNPTEGKSPLPGDFYELGTRTNYKHVGVILDIDTILWTTVEGGQGGPGSGFDAIKRKGPQLMPSPLLGWIDIEEFYSGWGG